MIFIIIAVKACGYGKVLVFHHLIFAVDFNRKEKVFSAESGLVKVHAEVVSAPGTFDYGGFTSVCIDY